LKVVVLCGGQGTRLREETEHRPKPMVEVGGRPLLWHIMKIYAHFGFTEFVLCLGYKSPMIKEYFLNYEAMNNDFTITLGERKSIEYVDAHAEQNFCVTLADTGLDTMTGGRIRRAARYLDGDTFFVTYGDGLADVNIAQLLAFHRSHGKLATITAVRPTSRFGVLNLSEDKLVSEFREKPQAEGWINAGFCVFDKKVLELLDGDDCVLEQGPLQKLADEKQLMAFQHEGFFFAMDTYREYLQLNAIWDGGGAPWKVWS